MFNYLSYKELWNLAEINELSAETLAQKVFWRSMLSADEIKKVVELVHAFYNAKTFSDFLSIVNWNTNNFSQVFERNINEIEHWISRTGIFPTQMKKAFAFMIITNILMCDRQKDCCCCGETFLSTQDENYCEFCKPMIEKTIAKNHEGEKSTTPTVQIQIELICKHNQ